MTSDTRRHAGGDRGAKRVGPRVLLIGMDIADGELVDRWCREGALPTLQRLRAEGIWGRPRTTAEVMHVSAWPTVHTGAHPGVHGIYHAFQARAGEQGIRRADARDCAAPPFWKYLDEAGRRCVVIDAFFTRPLDPFRGVQVNEYGTWTWFAEPGAAPARVWSEIRSRFGAYPFPEHSKVLTVPEPRSLRERLRAAACLKAQVVRWLLREEPWDFFYVSFAETHAAGHYLWNIVDPAYPSHPADSPPDLENSLRDVYVAVDAAIGTILREVDDSVTVIVVSADGMGPNYAGCYLVPEVLHRLGLFFAPDVGGEGAGAAGGRAPRKGLLASARELVPLKLRQEVTRRLPRGLHYRLSTTWASQGIDWGRTKAFVIPNANEGYVRLNLKGREPLGIVAEGAESDGLLTLIGDALAGCVVPATGRPAVGGVFRVDDLFPGPERPNLPDLVVTWDPESRVLSEMASAALGTVRREPGYRTAPYYSGNHRPNAFLIARGPRIRAGDGLGDRHLIGLAPTLLSFLGCDVPCGMSGEAWGEFLR